MGKGVSGMARKWIRLTALACCFVLLLSMPAQAFGIFGFGEAAADKDVVKARKLTIQPRSCELIVAGAGSAQGSIVSSVRLSVVSRPENADLSGLTWKSSRPHVATVSEDGTVTAVSGGTAVITATDSLSRRRVSCTVRVYVLPASLTMKKETLTLQEKRSATLRAVIAPARPIRRQDKIITWVTSDPNVATVTAKGRVTAVSPGTATITAVTGNGCTAVCEVTVEARK